MFADNPMPIYQLATCMLCCGEHRTGCPPGATLGVDQDYITDVHTRAAGLQLGEVLANSEVERGNGLTIVTEGTQFPISFWRFHQIAGMAALCHSSVWRYYNYPEISVHSLSEQGAHARYIAFYLFKSKENTMHMVRPVQGARICLNAKLWAHCYQ